MKKINFENNVTKANADTFNTMQDNIEEAISYSTNEIQIGTWIDGKPIYRKAFEWTNTTNTAWEVIGSIGAYESVIKIYGSTRDKANNTVPCPVYGNDQTIFYISNSGSVYKLATSYYSNKSARVIIEYTKTTD